MWYADSMTNVNVKRIPLTEFAVLNSLTYATAYELFQCGDIIGIEVNKDTVLIEGWNSVKYPSSPETKATASGNPSTPKGKNTAEDFIADKVAKAAELLNDAAGNAWGKAKPVVLKQGLKVLDKIRKM